MMNKFIIFSLFTLFPFSLRGQSGTSSTQSNVFVPIAKYIERGDADCLSAWFAKNIEINVMGNTSNCSKTQARQILRNFFTNYTPKSFVIIYKSGSYPMRYAVGNLDGGGCLFTVTILVKTNNSGNYIEQLKIEKK